MSGYKPGSSPQASSLWHAAARLSLTARLSAATAIINTPLEYNEPYHDPRFPAGAVDSSHLTARRKSNVKAIDSFNASSPSQMAYKWRASISCSAAVHKHSPWQNRHPGEEWNPRAITSSVTYLSGKFVNRQSALAWIEEGEGEAAFISNRGC